MIERFGDDQGVTELPTFDGELAAPDDRTLPTTDNSYYRPSSKSDTYYPTTDDRAYPPSDTDYSQQMQDGYLTSAVANTNTSAAPLNNQPVQTLPKPAPSRGVSNRNDSYL